MVFRCSPNLEKHNEFCNTYFCISTVSVKHEDLHTRIFDEIETPKFIAKKTYCPMRNELLIKKWRRIHSCHVLPICANTVIIPSNINGVWPQILYSTLPSCTFAAPPVPDRPYTKSCRLTFCDFLRRNRWAAFVAMPVFQAWLMPKLFAPSCSISSSWSYFAFLSSFSYPSSLLTSSLPSSSSDSSSWWPQGERWRLVTRNGA